MYHSQREKLDFLFYANERLQVLHVTLFLVQHQTDLYCYLVQNRVTNGENADVVISFVF